MKKKFIVLALVIMIISLIPVTMVGCGEKASLDEALLELVEEFSANEHLTTVVELNQFKGKQIQFLDSTGFGTVLLTEQIDKDGVVETNYIVYDWKNNKTLHQKSGESAVYTLELSGKVFVEKIVGETVTYNYYSPRFQKMLSAEQLYTINSNYKSATINSKTYNFNNNGELIDDSLKTYSFKSEGFKYYANDNQINIVNEEGKTIFKQELSDKVKVFPFINNTLIRQKVIELPDSEKKYTFVEGGVKYKIEQTLITLKKNKAKEKKIKDVKYYFNLVMPFSLYIDELEVDSKFKDIAQQIAMFEGSIIEDGNIVKKNVTGYIDEDFNQILSFIEGLSGYKVVGKNILIEDGSDCYIYDTQGNIKADLSEYDVESIADGLLEINNKYYDYNLNEVKFAKKDEASVGSLFGKPAWVIENETDDPAEPQTSTVYTYDAKTNSFVLVSDKVVNTNNQFLLTYDGQNYKYSLINQENLKELKVSNAIAEKLVLTKEEYDNGVLIINENSIDYGDGAFITIIRTVDGESTYDYLLLK